MDPEKKTPKEAGLMYFSLPFLFSSLPELHVYHTTTHNAFLQHTAFLSNMMILKQYPDTAVTSKF